MINSAFTPGFLAVLGSQYARTDIQSVDDTTRTQSNFRGNSKNLQIPKNGYWGYVRWRTSYQLWYSR